MDEKVGHEHGGDMVLVLTRKSQESVVVGGSDRFQRILKVKVLEIRGDKVKLGFDVEADVPVHRLEVYERIVSERRQDHHIASTTASGVETPDVVRPGELPAD